jgi:superfamily II DNA or RNA helicase
MFNMRACEPSKLSESDQKILLLIFLLGETNAHTITQIGRGIVKESGGNVSAVKEAEVTAVIGRLKGAALVRQVRAYVACAPLSLASQRALFNLPQAKAYMRHIESSLQLNAYDYAFHCLRFASVQRLRPYFLVHEALLNNNVPLAEDLRRGNLSRAGDPHWLAFCEQLAAPILAEPASVSPSVLFHLFENLAETALKQGLPTAALSALLEAHVETLNPLAFSPQKFLALCAWHTWSASRAGLRRLSSKASEPLRVEALAACSALLAGDWPTADKTFGKVLKLFTSYPTNGSADACGNFFFLAALAAIRANVSQTRVRAYINKLSTSYDARPYFDRVGVSLVTLNEIVNRGSLFASPSPSKQLLPLDGFVRTLESLFLEDYKIDKEVRKSCAALLADARQAGYAFMAASLAPCVRSLCPNDPAAAETCRLVEEEKAAAPLWGAAHVVLAWEHALAEIEALLPKPNSGKTEAADQPGCKHQLNWIVGFRAEDPDDIGVRGLSCRLLKRLKSGQWSVGQSLSLDKLRKGEYDAYLDEVDRPVKDAVSKYLDTYDYDSYYDDGSTYRILPSLIGHPHVFTPKETDYEYLHQATLIPIRIERGEPAIDIRSANDGGSSKLRVPWFSDAKYKELQITCDHPGVYTVFEKSSLHQRLAGIVAKYGKDGCLTVPAQGGEALKRLLAPLAQVIGVKGEFDAEAVSARTVEGGVGLHLRACFAGETLHCDLKNQPVAGIPFFVAPGHGTRKTLTRHNGETVAIRRDLEAEARAFGTFAASCPGLNAWSVTETHWEIEDFKDILEALNEVHALADQVSLDWPEGGEISVLRPQSASAFSLTSVAGADFWLEIGGNVALDNDKVIAFTDLLAKLGDRTDSFVRLSDRQFLHLTKNLVRQMELLASAGEVSKKTLTVPPSAIPLLDTLATGKDAFDFPSLARDRIADFRRAFKSDAPVPASLTCELRPYQRDGFVWLAKLAACGLGACLADDMGLGKTVQVLALLTSRAGDGPSLVIAPTSVIRNWADEAARFAPALRVTLLVNAEDRTLHIADAGPYDVVVSSYGLLPFEEDLLAGRDWNVVVLDEAQAVKNRLAKRAKIVKRFKGRMRVAATGTPVENNLAELWSLFDFLNPGLLGTHAQFERRFCNSDGSVSALLKKMTAPFILRRLKSAVLDELPPKTEITLSVTFDAEERALYESCRREALASLEGSDEEANRIMILAHLTKLRRACCHPSLIMPACGLPGQKVEALMELIDDLRANGHRTLVFSQFVDFLSIIRTRLDAAGVTYQYLDGSTPQSQRAGAVERFQRGEGDLFLISLKAGGTGLNLTAANYVILLDPWWNPAVEMQAADRAHRIGQRNPVTVYRLVTADTVEERVVALHAKKLALAEAILDDTASTRLSAVDLISLFKA